MRPSRAFAFAFALALALAAAAPAMSQRLVARTGAGLGSGGMESLQLFADAEAMNPAAPSTLGRAQVSVTGVVPYGLAELSETSAHGTAHTPWVSVSARVSHCGWGESHMTTVGGGLSRTFGSREGFRCAMGFEYYGAIHTLPFGERGASSFSAVGLYVMPSSEWTISIAARNIERRPMTYADGTSQEMPTTLWCGVRWQAREMFRLAAEVRKEIGREPSGHFAAGIAPMERLTFTLGFSTSAQGPGAELSAGGGWRWERVAVSAAVAHHQTLGLSSGASVRVELGK